MDTTLLNGEKLYRMLRWVMEHPPKSIDNAVREDPLAWAVWGRRRDVLRQRLMERWASISCPGGLKKAGGICC
jgi:hypothetical protein